MLVCPRCGSRNISTVIYHPPDGGTPRENAICADCGANLLVFRVKHLILRSANVSIKIRNQKALIYYSRLTFENGVSVEKVGGRYFVQFSGETLALTFGTRLSPKKPPAPLTFLR